MAMGLGFSMDNDIGLRIHFIKILGIYVITFFVPSRFRSESTLHRWYFLTPID